MSRLDAIAEEAMERCRLLARSSEEPGYTTRTFLSEPMRTIHDQLRGWMECAGMKVVTDHAGNLRGSYSSAGPPRILFIGSHLDTVPRAGAFDGMLGVVIGVSLIELLGGRRLPFGIEVIGFSEEEGVRFGVPFIGSRALIGDADQDLLARCDAAGISIGEAISAFGLDPSRIGNAQIGDNAIGYVEFHIEQGPVLESLGLPLGVVEAICGQSRIMTAAAMKRPTWRRTLHATGQKLFGPSALSCRRVVEHCCQMVASASLKKGTAGMRLT
jgi:allantoate deiminase